MEVVLKLVYEKINDPKFKSGQISLEQIYLLQENDEAIDDYTYWAFIDADGPPFGRLFFAQGEISKNRGAKRFKDAGLKILETHKGDKAISFFTECSHMIPRTEASTSVFEKRNKIIKEGEIQGPQIGEKDFTKAKKKDLLK